MTQLRNLTSSIHVRRRMTQVRVETCSEDINSKIKQMLTQQCLSCLFYELTVVYTASNHILLEKENKPTISFIIEATLYRNLLVTDSQSRPVSEVKCKRRITPCSVSHPITLRPIVILSSHLLLGFPTGLAPFWFFRQNPVCIPPPPRVLYVLPI
jgi:hypothetical protein